MDSKTEIALLQAEIVRLKQQLIDLAKDAAAKRPVISKARKILRVYGLN